MYQGCCLFQARRPWGSKPKDPLVQNRVDDGGPGHKPYVKGPWPDRRYGDKKQSAGGPHYFCSQAPGESEFAGIPEMPRQHQFVSCYFKLFSDTLPCF